MIKLNFKVILLIVILFFSLKSNTYAKLNTEIIFKINNEIVTNIDFNNEIKFLLFLNPNLKNLNKDQIENISKNYLTNKIIKEIELKKYFELDKNGLGKKYIDKFLIRTSLNDIDDLKNKLSEFNLEYSIFEKNLIIDNLWKEFIFNKFKSNVKVDIENLRKSIQNKSTELEEINLSEILFKPKSNLKFEDLKEQIYSEINNSGFEAAASIFSISNSKNYGGKLGWIRSSQISKEIYSKLKNEKKITDPIKTNNGYLILKINDRRKITETVQLDKELKKLVELETEKELNKFGYIYFNKLKKRTFISEN